MRKLFFYSIVVGWALVLTTILSIVILRRVVGGFGPIIDSFQILLPLLSLATIIDGLSALYRKGAARGETKPR